MNSNAYFLHSYVILFISDYEQVQIYLDKIHIMSILNKLQWSEIVDLALAFGNNMSIIPFSHHIQRFHPD